MTDDLEPHRRAAQTKRTRTRNALLDAAVLVFSEKGWSARMEDIARHAGVGAATAYKHFPTKTELMMRTFERFMEPFQEKAEHDIAVQMNPEFAVTRHITELCHQVQRSHKNLVAAYLTAISETARSATGPIVVEMGGGTPVMTTLVDPGKPLADLIHYGQEAGRFRSDESAWMVGAYHTYAILWMIVGPLPPPMGENTYASLVLSQMLPWLKLKPGQG
ncbi:TetR/AcrR family transcriptional regulator [Streptomyces broussonetiae]|uniref:TetR/AcrR family transcriptional regulator n=1 Tax=Streptomyces broussonetiae TaxID=2686304 RepID=A0ABV5EJW5_9ACTN